MASSLSVKDKLIQAVGFLPKDAIGWLYVARGFYKTRDYHYVIEAVNHCLRNEKTLKEAQHLLAFSLMHTGQTEMAAAAFKKSIKMGNETDWQVIVELCIANDTINLANKKMGR